METEIEEWTVILKSPQYSVSNLGQVVCNKTHEILPQFVMNSYYYVQFKNLNFAIHRLVAEAFIDNPENKRCVDHIDNNKLNNRVDNLRWATHMENSRNAKLSVRNKSGVKGVYWNAKFGNWSAKICVNYKLILIGYYKTKEEAVKARQEKSNELFGTYVNLCETIISA